MFPEYHPSMDPQHLSMECVTLLSSLPKAQQKRLHRAFRVEQVQDGKISLQCSASSVQLVFSTQASAEIEFKQNFLLFMGEPKNCFLGNNSVDTDF